MKWLVAAFEPFAGVKTNSSWISLSRLKNENLNKNIEFLDKPIPVIFGQGWTFLKNAIQPYHEGVLVLGQAESRGKICLERVSLNWVDARIKDAMGNQPYGKIISDDPDILWSQIPWERFDISILCDRSYSAGTYVCNELMYHLTKWASANSKFSGFVHIPALTSQTEFKDLSQAMDEELVVVELQRIVRFLSNL